MSRAQLKNIQAFDEIHIKTVPHYKMSSASGDEWRYSAVAELKYKGKVLKTETYGDVDSAVKHLQVLMIDLCEGGKNGDDGDYIDWNEIRESKCDQEGCSNPHEVTLEIKQEYCKCCGIKKDDNWFYKYPRQLKFCKQHSTRGDCSIEDNDDNYNTISNSVQIQKPNETACTKSASVFLYQESDSDSECVLE